MSHLFDSKMAGSDRAQLNPSITVTDRTNGKGYWLNLAPLMRPDEPISG